MLFREDTKQGGGALFGQARLLQQLIGLGHFLFEKSGVGHRVKLFAYPDVHRFGSCFFPD